MKFSTYNSMVVHLQKEIKHWDQYLKYVNLMCCKEHNLYFNFSAMLNTGLLCSRKETQNIMKQITSESTSL